jgi:hypothetical protein
MDQQVAIAAPEDVEPIIILDPEQEELGMAKMQCLFLIPSNMYQGY